MGVPAILVPIVVFIVLVVAGFVAGLVVKWLHSRVPKAPAIVKPPPLSAAEAIQHAWQRVKDDWRVGYVVVIDADGVVCDLSPEGPPGQVIVHDSRPLEAVLGRGHLGETPEVNPRHYTAAVNVDRGGPEGETYHRLAPLTTDTAAGPPYRPCQPCQPLSPAEDAANTAGLRAALVESALKEHILRCLTPARLTEIMAEHGSAGLVAWLAESRSAVVATVSLIPVVATVSRIPGSRLLMDSLFSPRSDAPVSTPVEA